MNIIVKPVVTEKMTQLGDKLNRYAFIVDKKANKIQIKKAVEELYAGTTKVEDVTVNYSGSTIAKPNGTTSNLNTDNLTVSMNNKAGKVKFNIAGTATMPADTDVVLAKNTEYTVKHKVTCIQ